MATERVVLTYEDYAALPNDGRRYEVHDGELSVTPSPGTLHQHLVGHLVRLLADHVESRRLGVVCVSPLDVILAGTTIVQPDMGDRRLGAGRARVPPRHARRRPGGSRA
ncbi:MAG TPA: Uma2 family endonuclease [Methylomirabilota bacterium]|nr:Uma2 family endonuclease [Methylomirabilota bacterium]